MKDYWARRYEELMNRAMLKGDKLNEKIAKMYAQELAQMTNTLTAWHKRYAKANNITLAEARKQLRRKEAEELQWTVDEYIKNGSADNLTGTIKAQLENASINYHISRLQALQVQMIMHLNDLYTAEEKEMHSALGKVLRDTFNHSIYERQRVRKKMEAFSTLPQEEIEHILGKAYATDGLNFSERTWKNRDKLIQDVEQVITTGLIRGRNSKREAQELAGRIYNDLQVNDIAQSMAEKMKNANRASKRIVLTESAFFANEGVARSCAELGIEKYQLIATLDTRTSSICQEMDLQVFNFSEKVQGVNYPPFHPYCRTVATPYDEFMDENETRIARDKDGNTIYVPHDMTYKEWYNKYMEEPENNGATPGKDGNINESIIPERVIDWDNLPEGRTAQLIAQGRAVLTGLERTNPEYIEAVRSYTGNDYVDINKIERGLEVDEARRKELAPIIKNLKQLLKLAPTSTDIVTYRGQPYRYIKDWEVGSIQTLEGFYSTSTNTHTPGEFISKANRESDGSVLMIFRIPKGSEGMYIASHSRYKNEDELLLNSGVKVKVVYKGIEDGANICILEVQNDNRGRK